MGLYKTNYITAYGVEAQYWKIAKVNIDIHYEACDIVLHGYATQEARLNGKEPLETKRVRAHWGPNEFKMFFAPNTFSTKHKSVQPIKEDKSIKPYMWDMTKTLSDEEVGLQPSDNIYERAYAFVKMDEFFSTCSDII